MQIADVIKLEFSVEILEAISKLLKNGNLP